MPLMKYHNGTTWVPLDAENANKLGGKTPSTTNVSDTVVVRDTNKNINISSINNFTFSQSVNANSFVIRDSAGYIAGTARFANGVWSDNTTVIGINSTYTKRIPLGFAARKGRFFAHKANGEDGIFARFTTDPNESVAIYADDGATAGSGMYSKAVTGRLSYSGMFGTSILITDAYIDSTTNDLVILFKNGSTSATSTLNVRVLWEVES